MISNSEKNFIIDGCRENCRQDGRTRNENRSYMTISGSNPSIESNDDSAEQHLPPLVLSNGSARVFLATGETHVLVSVKAELVTPAMSHPDCGVLGIHVDYMHNPQGMTNSKREDSMAPTIASLLLPHLVDPKQLCVVAHHFVWKLHLDVMVLASNGGSLLDACSLGIQAALRNTVLPQLTPDAAPDGGRPILQIDADLQHAVPIPGSEQAPIISTVSLLKPNAGSGSTAPILILDATQQEEACAVSQVHVVLDRSNKNQKEPLICAIHKAGGGALPFSLLQDVTSFALEANGGAAKVCSGSGQEHLLQETFLLQ